MGWRSVSRPYEENQDSAKSLMEAGLVEIRIDEFRERIRDVKHVAMGRLAELLELKTGSQEQQSVAHLLGFLKRLETTLQEDARLPKPEQSSPSEK
jgi:DNA-binding ferritin-like protein